MTDIQDRERESAANEGTRWELAGEEEARRRHAAAERLKADREAFERADRDDAD
jgi:hypothetical protein